MVWFVELIKFMTELLSPTGGSNPDKVRRYRLGIATMLVGSVLGGGIFSMLALGWVPPVFSGFASARKLDQFEVQDRKHWGTVSAWEAEDRREWALSSADSLLQMDQIRCKLPEGQLRQMYDQLIQRRREEYRRLTGRRYSLPDCRDL